MIPINSLHSVALPWLRICNLLSSQVGESNDAFTICVSKHFLHWASLATRGVVDKAAAINMSQDCRLSILVPWEHNLNVTETDSCPLCLDVVKLRARRQSTYRNAHHISIRDFQ